MVYDRFLRFGIYINVVSTAGHRRRQAQAGLTLMELLVTVTIIAVLMALLLPVVTMVRVMAKSVRCQGNLRQLALGQLVYAQDNNNVSLAFIGNGKWVWMNLLPAYLDKETKVSSRGQAGVIYDCPGWLGRIADDGTHDLEVTRSGTAAASGYAYNGGAGLPATNATNGYDSDPTANVKSYKLAAITSPENRMAFADANFWNITNNGTYKPTIFEKCTRVYYNAYYVSPVIRHRAGGNYAMFSGRVLKLRPGSSGDAARSHNNPGTFTK